MRAKCSLAGLTRLNELFGAALNTNGERSCCSDQSPSPFARASRGHSPNQVLTHAARAADSQLNKIIIKTPLRGPRERLGSGDG